MARSPNTSTIEDDFSVDYFGDLEGANVDELELSPRKEHTFRRLMMPGMIGVPTLTHLAWERPQICTF